MRRILSFLLLVLLVPVLYVGSALLYFPAILWHGVQPPRSSALMEIREAQAKAADREWEREYQWTPLESISPHLVQGVLAAEDTRFYEHGGFDLEQIREAWKANRQAGATLRGASTITQQTVKNLYLTPSRNVLRKAREAILTAWMELWLPKDRILELYLNVVELGPGVFGAQAGAARYFGRSASGMSREQAALLAATLPAPLSRNPGASTPGLRRRQRMILSRMHRWYEGPSVAEQEATGEVRVEAPAELEPEVLEAEPLEFEPIVEPPLEGGDADLPRELDAGEASPSSAGEETPPPLDPNAPGPPAEDPAPESEAVPDDPITVNP